MVDVVLVHDVGHGAWCWGKVWGRLTAPVEHPPRLYVGGKVGKVVTVDLPGKIIQPGDDPTEPSLDDYVDTVTGAVQSQGLGDVLLVGHGASAPVVLHAAARLEQPPGRVVLLAGVLPAEGKSVLDTLPRVHRMGLKASARMSRLARREFRLPKTVIDHVYCRGMDPFDVIQFTGWFTPLPMRFFRSPVYLDDIAIPCPVTYVSLWRDALVPLSLQQKMASRLDGIEIGPEVDSCHEVMLERPRELADLLVRYA
jgi:pimeloyl-ACP methyl ester carboxylesterase